MEMEKLLSEEIRMCARVGALRLTEPTLLRTSMSLYETTIKLLATPKGNDLKLAEDTRKSDVSHQARVRDIRYAVGKLTALTARPNGLS